MGDTIGELITEARRLGEGDCLYSEKGHFVATRAWRAVGYSAGALIAVLGAVIGTGELSKWEVSDEVLGSMAMGRLLPRNQVLEHPRTHSRGLDSYFNSHLIE